MTAGSENESAVLSKMEVYEKMRVMQLRKMNVRCGVVRIMR